MAQLLSNEDEVLEAFDPSIAATRRFKYVKSSMMKYSYHQSSPRFHMNHF